MHSNGGGVVFFAISAARPPSSVCTRLSCIQVAGHSGFRFHLFFAAVIDLNFPGVAHHSFRASRYSQRSLSVSDPCFKCRQCPVYLRANTRSKNAVSRSSLRNIARRFPAVIDQGGDISKRACSGHRQPRRAALTLQIVNTPIGCDPPLTHEAT